MKCPHCQAENEIPPAEAGNARACVKCGRAIPSHLTVAPDAKPHVKTAAKPDTASGRAVDMPFRVSFTPISRAKESPMQGLMLAVVIGLALLLLFACFWWLARAAQPTPPSPITESPVPAKMMSQLAFQRDNNDFMIYFTLINDEGKEIARPGLVKLSISEISKIGLEGAGTFSQENKLYENQFKVDVSKFIWYDPGMMLTSFRRLVCAVRVPASELSKQPAPRRAGKVTLKFHDGHDPERVTGLSQKFFF
ncbi:MAG: hypothetical protein HZA91_02845 [Verrucomicrobia bacterium]|nr:hypothetical protein [Verrucomicrobiota bacterium]